MAGRRQRPYKTSWNEYVPGLARDTDGRWRIVATGQRFSEQDERLAVNRFRQMTGWKELVSIAAPVAAIEAEGVRQSPALVAVNRFASSVANGDRFTPEVNISGDRVSLGYDLDSHIVWNWLREQLIERPEWVAKQVRISELASLRSYALPSAPIRISDIIKAYQEHNPSTGKAKDRALKVFNSLVKLSDAKTLDDLTQDVLLQYRSSVENSKTIKSGATKKWMFGAIKSTLAFGLKAGLDEKQIRACLDRCRVLWTATKVSAGNPTPISRDNFHKLLTAAKDGTWRAWLLMGLNAALYIEELCDLKWESIDLDRGVYATIRTKTAEDKIPRAAVLWPETIAALKAIQRTGSPYVFVSKHGTRYASSNVRCNAFADLRAAAGVDASIGFSHLRDGAYTTACMGQPDDRLARVMAGQRAPGLQDRYVLRNPEMVRPACDAVYRAYGPFPL